mmetsp:Transcript_1454/g.2322  ORF Transcript_1454/g.2322 Transcript_1454/m.2322 type:complete len:111 (-) Transcript_1454:188-520(-)
MGNETSETLRKLAAALGASGVGLGAFGAHALKGYLSKKPEGSNNWKTAVSYQLLHAVALLSLSCLEEGKLRKYRVVDGVEAKLWPWEQSCFQDLFIFSLLTLALSAFWGP